MNKLFICGIATTVWLTVFAAPKATVTDVQCDPVSHRISVSYTLDAPAVVTAELRVDGSPFGPEAGFPMSGDVNKLVTKVGVPCGIGWTPGGPVTNFAPGADVRVAVKAWATNAPPDWLVVDLVEPYEARYYVSAAAIPGGIAGAVNKTDKMVMRKIPASGITWKMGTPETEDTSWPIRESQHDVKLTDDFYIGVYPVTLGQYKAVFGGYGSSANFTANEDRDFIPANSASYNALRGSVADGIDWPNTAGGRSEVAATSLIKTFRDKMTFLVDLPTDAQWEFACRAGKGTKYNDGSENCDAVAWYQSNSESAAHPVGAFPPNAFGLYDMHGNVLEWCLDWLDENVYLGDLPTENPVGATTSAGNTRVMRGGSYNYAAVRCRSAFREAIAPNSNWANLGFRLACPAEAVK